MRRFPPSLRIQGAQSAGIGARPFLPVQSPAIWPSAPARRRALAESVSTPGGSASQTSARGREWGPCRGRIGEALSNHALAVRLPRPRRRWRARDPWRYAASGRAASHAHPSADRDRGTAHRFPSGAPARSATAARPGGYLRPATGGGESGGASSPFL